MWYDLIIAAVLLFCMVRGARKGFLWQLAAIAAVVLCFVFAETASVAIAPYLKIDPPLNRWVSMLLLYVACSFVCFAVARGLQNGLEKAKFEAYDRHLGGLFGLIKGAGIAVILTFFAVTLSERLRPTVLSSHSGHASAVVMNTLSPVFPQELGKVLKPYLDEFEGFEEGFGGTHLVEGRDEPGDLFGDDGDGFGESAPGGLWGGGAGGFGDGPVAGGGASDPFGADPFGWASDSSTDRRGDRPRDDGAFGDSSFGEEPGEGGGWFDDGRLNTDRLRDEAGGMARRVWDDVPEETRRDMTDSLADAAANEARRRAEEKFGVRLDDFLGGGDPADPAATPGPTRQELIADIAAVYNRDETVQAMIRRQSAQALGPVPEQAALDVLKDWLADLRGAPVDPDPGTTKATTLQERIARRLSARTAQPTPPTPRR